MAEVCLCRWFGGCVGRVAARARHARCSLPAVCPAGEPWPCVRAGQVAQGDRGLLPLPLRVTSVGTGQPEGSGAGRLPAGPLRVGGVCRAGRVPAVPGAAAPGSFHPEITALSHPSLPSFFSPGLRSQLLQLDGLPVPPEALRQAARRGRQARLQLPTLRQEVQIQGWPRLPCAVRTPGLGEPPGHLRSPRNGASPPCRGLQSCRACGQDRAGQGRAGQGRCRRRTDVVFSLFVTSRVRCTLQCRWGTGDSPLCPSPKSRELCLSEGSGGRCSPAPAGLPSCAPAKKNKRSDHSSSSQQAPAARHR